MGKKIRISILVTIVVLIVLFLFPCPLNTAKAADGGTKVYRPIIPLYVVVDWNQIHWAPHSDKLNPDSESYDPNAPKGETIKGLQVFVSETCIYDGRYTVEGIHARQSNTGLLMVLVGLLIACATMTFFRLHKWKQTTWK